MHVERDPLELHRLRFKFGKVQHVINDRKQALRRFANSRCTSPLLGRKVGVEQNAGHTQHPIHGRANLVAHHRQEFRLGFARRLGRIARIRKRPLDRLAFCDVGDIAVNQRHAIGTNAGLPTALEHPAHGAVLAEQPVLDLVGTIGLNSFRNELGCRLRIIGMHQRSKAAHPIAEEVATRMPGQLLNTGTDELHCPFFVDATGEEHLFDAFDQVAHTVVRFLKREFHLLARANVDRKAFEDSGLPAFVERRGAAALHEPLRLAAGQNHPVLDFVRFLAAQRAEDCALVPAEIIGMHQLKADRRFSDHVGRIESQLLFDTGAIVFHDRRLAEPRPEQNAVDVGGQVGQPSLTLGQLFAQIVLVGNVEDQAVGEARQAVLVRLRGAAALQHPPLRSVEMRDLILDFVGTHLTVGGDHDLAIARQVLWIHSFQR